MEEVIYRPFKKNITSWKQDKKKKREDVNGRGIICTIIGKKIYRDNDTKKETGEKDLCEDIYADILKNILINSSEYKATIAPGSEPKVVITYNGNLIMHNDKTKEYCDKIITVLKNIDYSLLVAATEEGTLHLRDEKKFGQSTREITRLVNDKCNSDFPSDLIYHVVKEYVCLQLREVTDLEEKMRYESYEYLVKMAKQVLIDKKANKNTSLENALKEDLLYKLISGELILCQ